MTSQVGPVFIQYLRLIARITSSVQGFLILQYMCSWGTKSQISLKSWMLKSVQSALSDLLTTSATHGTFFRLSTKRGLILIGLELNTNVRESFEHC